MTVEADLTGAGAGPARRSARRPAASAEALSDELVGVRRDLHAHPELGRQEIRTTGVVADRLGGRARRRGSCPAAPAWSATSAPGRRAGWSRCAPTWTPCPSRTRRTSPTARRSPASRHACGHDVHTAVVLGAGLVLCRPGRERRRCRAGPAAVPAGRGADPRRRPGRDRGRRARRRRADLRAALRPARGRGPGRAAGRVRSPGPPTTSQVRLTGPGGHTARPHLTADLVLRARQGGHRACRPCCPGGSTRGPGCRVVWGTVSAGSAPNAIPREGEVGGHRAGAGRRRLGAAPRVVEEAVRAVVGAVRGGLRGDLRPRGAPGGQRRRPARGCWPAPRSRSPGPASVVDDRAEPGRGGLRLVPRGSPGRAGPAGRTPARRPGQPRPAPGRASTWTSGPIAVGVRLLAATAVVALLSLS